MLCKEDQGDGELTRLVFNSADTATRVILALEEAQRKNDGLAGGIASTAD